VLHARNLESRDRGTLVFTRALPVMLVIGMGVSVVSCGAAESAPL